MKKTLIFVLLTALAVFFVACGDQAGPANTENANAENSNKAEEPAKDPIVAVMQAETKAYEAWKNKNGKYFEEMATDNFVGNGTFTDKAGLVKLINEFPCDVKDVKLEDLQTVELTSDAFLVTAKTVADYTCDGKPGATPSWAAGVYVKDGDKWRPAFHQTVVAADAKGEQILAEFPAKRESATDELTKTLSAQETRWWGEWQKKETAYFESGTRDNFLQLGSDGRTLKATALTNSKQQPCEVKTFDVNGFKATQISENVAILTYTATQEGSCRGNAIPGMVFSTSIFVKDGDTWKGAFYMETPAKAGGDQKKAYGPGDGVGGGN